MRTREEKREERRQYHNDVEYEVWRRGGNPGMVDYDRVEDRYYDGHEADATARRELERQRPQPQEPEPCEQEQQPDER